MHVIIGIRIGGVFMWIYIVIAIAIMILIYVLIIYNKFITLTNKVKEAFATMDVYLKKRWDLIPNLVETVKGYAHHEQETLKSVTTLRNHAYDTMSNDEKLQTNEELNGEIKKIMFLAESYPDLKASENFKDLRKELTQVENDIANSRKYYNAVVRMYNNKVEQFPSNIFAKLFGYKPKKMFEIAAEERENIKVNL